jgi:hypothetical protein
VDPDIRAQPDMLRVRDVMTSNFIMLAEGTPVRTAALVLYYAEIGGLLW